MPSSQDVSLVPLRTVDLPTQACRFGRQEPAFQLQQLKPQRKNDGVGDMPNFSKMLEAGTCEVFLEVLIPKEYPQTMVREMQCLSSISVFAC